MDLSTVENLFTVAIAGEVDATLLRDDERVCRVRVVFLDVFLDPPLESRALRVRAF